MISKPAPEPGAQKHLRRWNTPYGQLRFVILLVFKGILVRLIPWAHGARKRPKARARITLFIEGLARMVT